MTDKPAVHAAVAVLVRDDGQVLLAQRPEGKPWAGWWEFPGGKIEQGESVLQALKREIEEELGTGIVEAYPWITRRFAYPERTVQLHFYQVRRWIGEPHGREGQALSWQFPSSVNVGPLLPANEPLLRMLSLPAIYAITQLEELGEPVFLARLQRALQAGLKLIQVREKHLNEEALQAFSAKVIALARPYGAQVLLNGSPELASMVNADGVHLSSQALMALRQKPEGLIVGASCHDAHELARAAELELNFVVFSPVLPTLSHPDAKPLGWHGLGEAIAGYALPVYALGGLQRQHLQEAWRQGAHGIALLRGAWNEAG
ncbi:Nudix family hydrolase [Methylovorus menthalis]|uniref:Nudix family hydrolase n=1 Tax=Methylovorus menthalis TaxID=1002227 RepID=UPI001E60212D|nr:Nudix family hydrolase [Methylovorus menthalis]MCB4810398.1 Nudix family hydrolase [Methylovorus menthalis]